MTTDMTGRREEVVAHFRPGSGAVARSADAAGRVVSAGWRLSWDRGDRS
ncbi:hypothetical protein TOK_0262 [Pseudonocardia sp. N23]|nr:hypothetical protein TOK_0262 [Pseudonocardia sp. N23]